MATTAIFTKIGDSVVSDEYKKTYNDNSNIYQKYVVTATLTAIDETNMTATLSLNQKLTSKYVRWGNVDKYFTLYVATSPEQTGTQVHLTGGGDESSSSVKTLVDQTVSFTIPYEANGTKTITVGGRITGETGSWAPGNTNKSISITLPTIARPSTFTITGTELGSNVKLSLTSFNSTFKHKAEYAFGNTSYSSIGEGLGTEINFIPSISLASNVKNAASGTLSVRVTTFNGTTQIGSPVINTHTLTIPKNTNTLPTAGTLTVTSSSTNSIVNGWGSDIFVAGYSKATISFSGATGKQGATISKYAVGGGGLDINNSSTTNSFTTGVLNTSEVTFSGKVIDSRRFESSTVSKKITLYEYSAPTITVTANRCNAQGTLDLNGTYLKVNPKITYSPIGGKNPIKTKSITCNNVSNTTFTSDQSFILAANASTSNSYNLTASVTDTIGNSNSVTIKIWNSNNVPLHVKETKNGMGIGRKANGNNTLELGWDVNLNGNKINGLIDLVYPVGSIYMSVNSTSPATLFGGTWSAMGGQFLIGANATYTAGSTGGAATVALSTANLPSHTHSVGAHSHGAGTLAADSVELKGTWHNDSARFPNTTNVSGIITVYKTSAAGYWSETGGTANNTTGFNINASHGHTISGSTANSSAFNTGSQGSGTAHNNMPPYLAVYMWKRTA